MIATTDRIGRWWANHTATRTESGLVLAHDPGPEHGVVKLRVVEMLKDGRVEWECISTHPPSGPASAWTGTHVVFEISERGNVPAQSGFGHDQDRVTVLDFRHSRWDDKYLGFCNFAWGTVLQKLKEVCESQ